MTYQEMCNDGWSGFRDGILIKPGNDGGIIDSRIVDEKWFVIFNDDREVIEDLDSQQDAIIAFINATA